jgi:long-subunit acyl-CoA synthetase (AMP-forming)
MSATARTLAGEATAPAQLLHGGGATPLAALHAAAQALGEALVRAGVRRVASRLDNGPGWITLDLALRAIGGVHIPVPTFFSPAQAAHALADSGAEAVVLPASAAPAGARALPGVMGETLALHACAPSATPALPPGTACITYTSGSTGQPKGVCLDSASLIATADALLAATAPLAPRRHLCLMPLSTLLENIGALAALRSGADLAVPGLAEIGYTGATGLDVPTLLVCLQRYRPHSAILFPQLLLALVRAAEAGWRPPSELRFLAVGGGRVGPALLARAAAVGLPVFEGYGLTECASVVCLNRPGAVRPGSVGRPLDHARVLLRDDEVWVDGPRCLGYLGGAPLPSGPVATGDLGHLDADGFLHLIGRRKHIFITSFGRNVSPEWVESELLLHPDIAQAMVVGEARAHNLAVIWPRDPGLSDARLQQALAEVNAGLPDYARIAAAVRAAAPFSADAGLLTGNGRLRRDAIAARYADAIAATYARLEAAPAVTMPVATSAALAATAPTASIASAESAHEIRP